MKTVLLFFALVENPPDDKAMLVESHETFTFGMAWWKRGW